MSGIAILAVYIGIFIGAFFVVKLITQRALAKADFTSLKTVTFGDESAVTADRTASVVSVLTVFLIWAAFTDTQLPVPQAPGPYVGATSFTYTVQTDDGQSDDGTVYVTVHAREDVVEPAEVPPGDGWAKDDSAVVAEFRSTLIRVDRNDELGRDEGAKVVAINGQPITSGARVRVDNGQVGMTPKGTLNFIPAKGLQMEPIWLPPPDGVWSRFIELNREGYQNFTLWQHTWSSLRRVIIGFLLGAIAGIPLGYAMGLTNWSRGWFDPIVEFMRPVPPLALIPLMIIWAGIGEESKIILLFLAALWIMTIAARSGVSGVKITKVHAAYSLGASKWQILRRVIIPNSLPEIFTGARVAMGVCWGTVVAAELVAAEKGLGMMIIVASKFQLTDIVIVGIILIGLIGFLIDIGIRKIETWLVPWKGKG